FLNLLVIKLKEDMDFFNIIFLLIAYCQVQNFDCCFFVLLIKLIDTERRSQWTSFLFHLN
ncbi:hypothetical protein D8Y11_11115, partial [Listeria innocua]|nr:hypothetical protein [Listeria innocua]